MDIVGPLEKSSVGQQYILVICDYATRYPEAFPLRRQQDSHPLNFSTAGKSKDLWTS